MVLRAPRSAARCSPSRTRIVSSCSSAVGHGALDRCHGRVAERLALRRAVADDQRLRQPQQIAGRQLAVHDARGCARRRWPRRSPARSPPAARRTAPTPAAAAPTRSSRRARAPARFCTSARSRASRSASADGRRSCRSRNRWLTARTVRPMRAVFVLAGQRGKAGHALDHGALSAFTLRPSSAAFDELHLVQPRIDAVRAAPSARRAGRSRRCGRARAR